MLGEADRITDQIGQLRTTVDTQVSGDVTKVNGLLSQIDALNKNIASARRSPAATPPVRRTSRTSC